MPAPDGLRRLRVPFRTWPRSSCRGEPIHVRGTTPPGATRPPAQLSRRGEQKSAGYSDSIHHEKSEDQSKDADGGVQAVVQPGQ